jgi:hypothetical protein
MRFQVFRLVVADQDVGFDDRKEGFGGEVAGLFAGEGLEVGLRVVVLVVFRADIVVY